MHLIDIIYIKSYNKAEKRVEEPGSMTEQQKVEKIQALAKQVLFLARDNILVSMRFFDMALTGLAWKEVGRTGQVATDGRTLQYDAVYLLQEYDQEPKRVTRTLLHVLLHCIFYHSFQYDKVDKEVWDMAVDMAVEHTILEMKLPSATINTPLLFSLLTKKLS